MKESYAELGHRLDHDLHAKPWTVAVNPIERDPLNAERRQRI
jgi:hypothetical protein